MTISPMPDDIKIIAQFLAEREGDRGDWERFAREAFKLRRQLKSRGSYGSNDRRR